MPAGGFQDHERVVAISRNHVEVTEQVYSNHEEADTRLILHIKCSIERFGTRRAIVWSPDTDVMILGVYFSHELGLIFGLGQEQKKVFATYLFMRFQLI